MENEIISMETNEIIPAEDERNFEVVDDCAVSDYGKGIMLGVAIAGGGILVGKFAYKRVIVPIAGLIKDKWERRKWLKHKEEYRELDEEEFDEAVEESNVTEIEKPEKKVKK